MIVKTPLSVWNIYAPEVYYLEFEIDSMLQKSK